MKQIFVITVFLLFLSCATKQQLTHKPSAGDKDDGIELRVTLKTPADSVVVCPVRDDSQTPYYTYRMEAETDGEYIVFVPKWRRGMPYDRTHNQKPKMPKGERFGDTFDYKIVVYRDGVSTTYPANGNYTAPMH